MTGQTPSTDDDLLETISDYAHDFDRGGHLTLDDVKHALAIRDAARDRGVAAKAEVEALRGAADAIDRQADTECYRRLPSEGLHAAIQALKNAARTLRFSIGAGDE